MLKTKACFVKLKFKKKSIDCSKHHYLYAYQQISLHNNVTLYNLTRDLVKTGHCDPNLFRLLFLSSDFVKPYDCLLLKSTPFHSQQTFSK